MFYKLILPESPRWLKTNGKTREAVKSLSFAAKLNGSCLPTDLQIVEPTQTRKPEKMENLNLWTLVTDCDLLVRLVVLSVNWIVVTLLFYGLSFQSAQGESVFENAAAMAAVEMPAYLICMLVIECCGRRSLLMFCQILAGVSCLTAALVPLEMPMLKLCCSLLGKLGASAAFAIIYPVGEAGGKCRFCHHLRVHCRTIPNQAAQLSNRHVLNLSQAGGSRHTSHRRAEADIPATTVSADGRLISAGRNPSLSHPRDPRQAAAPNTEGGQSDLTCHSSTSSPTIPAQALREHPTERDR